MSTISKKMFRLKRAARLFVDALSEDLNRRPYHGDKYYCPACETGLAYFNPIDFSFLKILEKHNYAHSFFSAETFNWDGYSCPKCSTMDRNRLYILYLKKVFKNVPTGQKINFIDFAPSPGVSDFLRRQEVINYRSADLLDPNVDDNVDISDMNTYQDNTFDAFLCSHVLEHVKEDRRAMKELYRILKPGGWGILMVPINLFLESDLEDDNIVTVADKWKYYGQDDHVRMYSKKGFLEKIRGAGFTVEQLGMDYFGEKEFERHGIHPKSVLYIVKK